MIHLGVNIDHVATLREARYRGRGNGEPDPVQAAQEAVAAGAQGITAHLREDRRHIQDRDIWRLREVLRGIRFNFEMANTPEIRQLALEVKPDIVCVVPERREEVTTEGGLDATGQLKALTETCRILREASIEISFFITPDLDQVRASAKAGAQYIELHTGSLAEHFSNGEEREQEMRRLIEAAHLARRLNLKVNAGHGLNYDNVNALFSIPQLHELNIGHSIVSRSVIVGMRSAVAEMLARLRDYTP